MFVFFIFFYFFFFIFFFNIYLFLGQRETEHERERGRERGRHRIRNRLQALSHQPRARHGARTPGPRDRDLAEVECLTDCATQAPQLFVFLNLFLFFFFESEREQASRGGAEREGDRIPSKLYAVVSTEPNVGSQKDCGSVLQSVMT